MAENAIYIKHGEPVPVPPSGQTAICVTSAGVLSKVASDGTTSAVATGGNVAAYSIQGNNTGSSAAPTDLAGAAISSLVARGTDTVHTLLVDGNTITVSGLNGDAEIEYAIYLRQFAGSAGNGNFFRPNGLTTDQAGGNCLAIAGAVVANEGGGSKTNLQICQSDGSGWIYFYAKTGGVRTFRSHILASVGAHIGSGVWTDTSTNLTSFTIVKDAGNFTAGSYVVVRRLYSGVGG